MTLKDKINKISAVGLILSAAVIASGYIFENKEIFNEPAKDMKIKSVKNKFFLKKILYLVIDYFRKIF